MVLQLNRPIVNEDNRLKSYCLWALNEFSICNGVYPLVNYSVIDISVCMYLESFKDRGL